jgi:hypothetical protein
MENDRLAIEALLAKVQNTLANVKTMIADVQAENLRMSRQLTEEQQQELRRLDELAPANSPLANVAP